MKSATDGNPKAISIVIIQRFTQDLWYVLSVAIARNFMAEKIVDLVTGVRKAVLVSIQAIMESFVYRSMKKLLQSCLM